MWHWAWWMHTCSIMVVWWLIRIIVHMMILYCRRVFCWNYNYTAQNYNYIAQNQIVFVHNSLKYSLYQKMFRIKLLIGINVFYVTCGFLYKAFRRADRFEFYIKLELHWIIMKQIQLTMFRVASVIKMCSVILEMEHMGRNTYPPLHIHSLHALCQEWMPFVYADVKSQLSIHTEACRLLN
jgi:hypothetical protein